MDLLVEDLLVVVEGCFTILVAVWGQAGLDVAIVQDFGVILRVQDEYWSLDVVVYVLWTVQIKISTT